MTEHLAFLVKAELVQGMAELARSGEALFLHTCRRWHRYRQTTRSFRSCSQVIYFTFSSFMGIDSLAELLRESPHERTRGQCVELFAHTADAMLDSSVSHSSF